MKYVLNFKSNNLSRSQMSIRQRVFVFLVFSLVGPIVGATVFVFGIAFYQLATNYSFDGILSAILIAVFSLAFSFIWFLPYRFGLLVAAATGIVIASNAHSPARAIFLCILVPVFFYIGALFLGPMKVYAFYVGVDATDLFSLVPVAIFSSLVCWYIVRKFITFND